MYNLRKIMESVFANDVMMDNDKNLPYTIHGLRPPKSTKTVQLLLLEVIKLLKEKKIRL